jgi:hypothetical protein
MDLPSHIKYTTSMKQEFIDHKQRSHLVETTAQIVGVNKGVTTFKKVSKFEFISSNILSSQSLQQLCMLFMVKTAQKIP